MALLKQLTAYLLLAFIGPYVVAIPADPGAASIAAARAVGVQRRRPSPTNTTAIEPDAVGGTIGPRYSPPPLYVGKKKCHCWRSAGKEYWDDDMDPQGRLGWLCANKQSCHQARLGNMCTAGDLRECACAQKYAEKWQGHPDFWDLPSSITCATNDHTPRFMMTITMPMYA